MGGGGVGSVRSALPDGVCVARLVEALLVASLGGGGGGGGWGAESLGCELGDVRATRTKLVPGY